MKTTFATALIALTVAAGAASAMTAPSALEAQVAAYPVAIDLNTLSDGEIAQVANLIHSGESSAEIVRGLQSIAK